MTKLKGRYYVRNVYGSGVNWEVTSENDNDELYVQGVPTKAAAQALCDVINAWIQKGFL